MDGVVALHIAEGVAGHRAYARSIHKHIDQDAAGISSHHKGPIAALAHQYGAIRGNGSASFRTGVNPVILFFGT